MGYQDKLVPIPAAAPGASYASKLVPLTPAPAPVSPTQTVLGGAKAALGRMWDAGKQGAQQVAQGFTDAATASNPIEAPLKMGEGAVKVVSAPFAAAAPLFAPIGTAMGKAIDFAGDKLSETKPLKEFGLGSADVAPGIPTTPERIVTGVSQANDIAGTIAGLETPKPLGTAIKTGVTKVADTATAASDKLVAAPGAVAKAVVGDKDARLIANRTKELQKLEDSYSTVRKVTQSHSAKGIDSKSLLAQTDLLHGSVDNTGTLRTTQPGGAVEQMNDFIKPHEKVVSASLAKEGTTLPLKTVQKHLTNVVDHSGLEGAALENAHAKVEAEIKGLTRRTDADGNILLAKIHDAKVNKYATINYLDPAAKQADKAIARGLKEIVEKHSSTNVQALNGELANHYAVLNLLEKLDGKKVEGGKLGKYFASTVGGMVGSHFGPLGTIVGAEAGARIRGAALAQKLKGKTGVEMEMSPAMQAATANVRKGPLLLGSGKRGLGPQISSGPTIPLGRGIKDEPQAP